MTLRYIALIRITLIESMDFKVADDCGVYDGAVGLVLGQTSHSSSCCLTGWRVHSLIALFGRCIRQQMQGL